MLSNTKILALLLGVGLAVSTAAHAQTGTPQGGKLGTVAIQQAIAGTNEGKKELDTLQQRFSPKQAELKSLNDEVENLKKQLQTLGDKLSDEERASRVRTIETKQKQLQRNVDDFQTEVQQAESEVMNRLGGKMLRVIEQYAQKNGYGVIMDISSPQTPVLYTSQGTDITKQLIEAYNAQAPAAAPAARPAARPAATAPAPK